MESVTTANINNRIFVILFIDFLWNTNKAIEIMAIKTQLIIPNINHLQIQLYSVSFVLGNIGIEKNKPSSR